MPNKGIFFFVEGSDDGRFIEKIIKPLLIKENYQVEIIEYSRKKQKLINNYIRNFTRNRIEYLFISDINNCNCPTQKKQQLINKYSFLNINKIVVVIKEIESWYLAGLGRDECNQLQIEDFGETNSIIKEKFNTLIPKKYQSSRINFMLEILRLFDLSEAKRRNKSFSYFINKFISKYVSININR